MIYTSKQVAMAAISAFLTAIMCYELEAPMWPWVIGVFVVVSWSDRRFVA